MILYPFSVTMELSLFDDIIARGEELNRQWINQNPNHFLTKTYEILHKSSLVFLSTSCEITAMMIRWQLSTDFNKWEVIDEPVSFEKVYDSYPVFQISIGEDYSDTEHIVTIYKGYILQSYYNKYAIEKNILTPNIIRAFNDPSGVSPKSYATITRSSRYPRGMTLKNTDNLKIYYWVPC